MLGLFALAGWWLGGEPQSATTAAKIFPIWLVVALTNMWLGVSRAGYSVAEELPILFVIFRCLLPLQGLCGGGSRECVARAISFGRAA